MKKLFIDLEKCYKCKKCDAKCSYYYHPENEGQARRLALAAQEHVCRRCDNAPCIISCPWEALAKREDGLLEGILCAVLCRLCTAACPFGVIYPEIVEYKTSQCDYCFGRSDDNTPPLCVSTCKEKALQWIEAQEDPEKDIYAVRGGKYYVYTVKWKKEK